MALAVAIAAASQIASGVQQISGGNAKDSERLAANLTAYNRAVAGDANARDFLKQRTGDFGVATVPGYGEVGGWATATAKADAKAKYAALTTAATVTGAIASAGETVRETANAAGYDIVPTPGGLRVEQLLVIGAVIVGVYLFVRSRR